MKSQSLSIDSAIKELQNKEESYGSHAVTFADSYNRAWSFLEEAVKPALGFGLKLLEVTPKKKTQKDFDNPDCIHIKLLIPRKVCKINFAKIIETVFGEHYHDVSWAIKKGKTKQTPKGQELSLVIS